MPEARKDRPQWIQQPGVVSAVLLPPPIVQKFRGGQRADDAEQYEQAAGDAALDALARAGITLVYIHYFSGYGIEFEKHETERAQATIGKLHERGLKAAALVSLGAIVPETLLLEEPEAQNWVQVGANGQVLVPPGAPSCQARPCYNCEGFMRYMERVCGQAAEHGADLVFFNRVQFSPEPHVCRCPICVAAFREMLRNRYGSQDEKKQQAGQERFGFNTFTHVRPPLTVNSAQVDTPHEQEWLLFKMQTVDLCLKRLSMVIQKRNSQCAIGADVLDPAADFDALRCGVHLGELRNVLDLIGVTGGPMGPIGQIRPIGPIETEIDNTSPGDRDPRTTYVEQENVEIGGMEIETPETGSAPSNLAPGVLAAIRNLREARALGLVADARWPGCSFECSLALQLAFSASGLGRVIENTAAERMGIGDHERKMLRAYVEFYNQYKNSLLLDPTPLAAIAVCRDTLSLAFSAEQRAVQRRLENALIEHNIAFDLVYDDRTLTQLQRYRCVVLAGCEHVFDEHVPLYQKFAGEGGGLLVIGESGSRDAWRRLRPHNALFDLLGSDPRGLRREYGKGRVAWLSADEYAGSAALCGALKFCTGEESRCRCDAESGQVLAECVRVTGGALVVHAINPDDGPAHGVKFSVAAERTPTHVSVFSPFRQHEPVDFKWDGTRVDFGVDELPGYALFQITF